MFFRQLFDPKSSTYTYLLGDSASGEAVLIDPVAEQVERDLQLIAEVGLRLIYTVDTHIHADHVTGAGLLRARTGSKTAVSVHAHVPCADVRLQEGDVLRCGAVALHVLETPGHTPTCMSLTLPGRVFTGDALLIRGCGRTDFQGGDASTLYASITNKLFNLPDDTVIYPGHDYVGFTVSTIGEERHHNPRLRLGREGFIRHMQEMKLPPPARMDEALPANLGCGQRQG